MRGAETMSYAKARENGYYYITGTPPTVIRQCTWERVCAVHGAWTAASPNQRCRACVALRVQIRAGNAATGLGTPGNR